MKKYRFSFEIWGLLLFLIVMLPTFIWLAIPAPNDILRENSITEMVDAIASVCSDGCRFMHFKKQRRKKIMRDSFSDSFGRLLRIIFHQLDSLLYRHDKCACYFRTDHPALFGIFILCH